MFSTFNDAEQDEGGYFIILYRTNDVINVAGHRIGTREINSKNLNYVCRIEFAKRG